MDGRGKGGLISTFACFDCCCRTLILGEDWALGYVCAQVWDFPNISLFPRILSLKLFGNSYTKFALVDITFRFTCGSSGQY